MSEGFAVDPEMLDNHASSLDGMRARIVGRTLGAAAGADSFGKVGRMFAGEVTQASRRGAESLARLDESLKGTTSALHETARTYDLANSTVGRILDQIGLDAAGAPGRSAAEGWTPR